MNQASVNAQASREAHANSEAIAACARALLVDEQEATIAALDKLGRAEQLLRHCRAAFRQIADMEGRDDITDAAFAKDVLDRIAPHWLERLDQYFAGRPAPDGLPEVRAA